MFPSLLVCLLPVPHTFDGFDGFDVFDVFDDDCFHVRYVNGCLNAIRNIILSTFGHPFDS